MSILKEQRHKYLDEINESVLRQIPANNGFNKGMVVDVGCGTGALSEAIEDKGYIVWGIDLNREAAQIASRRITKVINADLMDLVRIKTEIGGQLFDYLVFADILEHLYDPLTVMKEYLRFLKDGCYVIVSVPNTVSWVNRILFLFGKFDYTDTGIMDRDHIRFFTFKTAKDLVRSAGCSIIGVDYVPYFVRVAQPIIKNLILKNKRPEDTDRQQLLDSPYYKFYMKYIYPIEYLLGYFCKSLFAFKMIIVGKKIAEEQCL